MSDISQKSNCTNVSTSMQMQGLLNEFKLLYQNRLKKLELYEPHNEETTRVKIKTLESYVKDLLEQNDVLVQTIGELEREANIRVTKLETKLTKISNHFKELSSKNVELEKELKSLNYKKESIERELKNKSENSQILHRELDRLKASYAEAVKMLASKSSKCDDSILLNATSQNENLVKNLEESLSSAIKSKNDLLFELQERDKKIIELQHQLSELKYDLYDRDLQIKDLEESFNLKISHLQKIQNLNKDECKFHREFLQNELEKEDMRLKLANLNHDISCIISAFNNAKKTGKFELKNLFLKEIPTERLNGLFCIDEPSKRVHFAEPNATISTEILKTEIRHREDIINSLQHELKTLRNQYESLLNGLSQKETALSSIKSTLSLVHNKEIITSGQVFDKDMEIRKLKNEINDLKAKLELITQELANRKKEAKEKDCKLEINNLSNEVKELRNEIIRKDQQIIAFKDKLHEQNLEVTQYEKRIQELKLSLEECLQEKSKLIEDLNQNNTKSKSNGNLPQSSLESLKSELKSRDDLIQRLRQDILILQEKRDLALTELESEMNNFSQIQSRVFYLEEENAHLSTRLKQSHKETQEWKKSYDEERIKNDSNHSKFSMYDETLRNLKEQYEESQNQNQRLTMSLHGLQTASKDTREKLSDELNKRQEEIIKLKEELSRKEADSQNNLNEKLQLIQQLNEELDLKNQKISSQIEQIEKITIDVLSYKSKCDDQEKDIEKFRTQINEVEINTNCHITSLAAKLADKEENINKLQLEKSNQLKTIDLLEKELKTFKNSKNELIEEIGRLEARLENHHYDFQSENEILNSEIQRREDHIHRLKLDKVALEEQGLALEDKLRDYEILIGNLKQQILTIQCSSKSKDDSNYELEKQLEEYIIKIKQLNEEVIRLEDQIKSNSNELTNLHKTNEELEKKLQIKSEVAVQLRNSNENLEEKNADLKKKLILKDETLQKIATELERSKLILQTKSKECQQKIETIQQLEASLDNCEKELDECKKSLINDKSQSTIQIANLEKEINKLQSHCTEINENLRNTKAELDTIKTENTNLVSKLQSIGEEKYRIVDKNQHLEMQLVTNLEKHKICQIEVAQRDQNIIKYQTDINLLHEKYSSTLDELKIQQEEIERLNLRIKKQSNDLKEFQSINDKLEDQKITLDKQTKQLEYEIEIYKQDLATQDKTIENLKAEWTTNIRNHEEEILGYKQNFQILNEELAHTKSEVNEFTIKTTNLKQQIAELNENLDMKIDENERLIQDLNKYEALCKEQESKVIQYCTDLNVTRSHLDNANGKITQLGYQLNEIESKYELLLNNSDKLEFNTKVLNETIIELKFKLAEKESAYEALKNENTNLNQQIQNKCADLKKSAQTNESLTEELEKSNEEYNKLMECLNKTETAAKQVQSKLNEKNENYLDLENRLAKCQSELKNYQQKYQYSNDDILTRDNKITQLEYELEESANQLQMIKIQNHDLLNTNSNFKSDYENLFEQKRNAEKEITRLESSISELQMNFTSSHQHLKKEIGRLEAHAGNLNAQLQQSEKQIESLTDQIDILNENARKFEHQIDSLNREILNKNDEIERLQINMKGLKDTNLELEKANKEKENILSDQINEREHLKNEVNDARLQLQHCIAEKAHIEERFILINKNLEQIQEEIRQKVTEYVRVEQMCQKQQTEIKTLKDRTRSYEEEMNELKKFIEKLKKDLFAAKDEIVGLQQENSKYKNSLFKVQHELDFKKEQDKIIADQLAQNDHLLQQLQNELRNERNKQQESQRLISQLKQANSDLNNEKESIDKLVKDLTNKTKEKETRIQTIQQELDLVQQKLRESKEEMAEKDGQIKVISMNYASVEKQRQHLTEEIHKYEDAVNQFKIGIEKSQQQYRDCHSELLQTQQQVHDLKIIVSTIESNHRETLGAVAEKSKENAHLKNELANLKQSNDSVLDQISQYEEKYKYVKLEFKKIQEESLHQQQKLKTFDQEIVNLKNQIKSYEEKTKQLTQEISCKEEQILLIKVELQSVQEKYKIKSEEASKYETEIQNLNQKCLFLTEETKKLEISLDKSRDNGERLHKESEMVIANVNSWVHEQRNNSEKLAIKIREQATAIIHLTAEKDKYIHDIEILQQQIRKLNQDLENATFDKEKIKALQNHLNQQQLLLHQLQSRLKEYESKIYMDNSEGIKTVEELQNRIRSNIDTIQLLNHQISSLQHEVLIQKEALEKETAARQTLQLQLESKNQLIQSLTAPSPHSLRRSNNVTINNSRSNSPSKTIKLNKDLHQHPSESGGSSDEDSPEDIGYTSSPSRSGSLRVPLREKNNQEDETENTDSEYWKQKANELSAQLEQTKKFWTTRIEYLQPKLNKN